MTINLELLTHPHSGAYFSGDFTGRKEVVSERVEIVVKVVTASEFFVRMTL